MSRKRRLTLTWTLEGESYLDKEGQIARNRLWKMCLGEEEGSNSWRVWWEIRQTDGQSMRTPEIQAQKLCSFLLLNWSMVDLQCRFRCKSK